MNKEEVGPDSIEDNVQEDASEYTEIDDGTFIRLIETSFEKVDHDDFYKSKVIEELEEFETIPESLNDK